jgi:hypothetical protein
MHKSFTNKKHQRSEYWMRSAVELAGLLLRHRVSTLSQLELPELKIYERVSGELLSRTIWKYSEAHGKLGGNRFLSPESVGPFR